MKDNIVKVKFHGNDWNIPQEWDLNVHSVSEAMRAIEANTQSLYKELIERDEKNIRYCLVINGNNFQSDSPLETMNEEDIKSTELCANFERLDTIDIIPVIEGADSDVLGIFTAILGVVLIVVGIILIEVGIGVALIGVGLGLLGAGVFSLLSKPPVFEDFREIEQGGSTSYLFSGPQNIIGEGGPVPLGYGRLVVGSQVISAALTVVDFDVDDTSNILRNEYDNIKFIDTSAALNLQGAEEPSYETAAQSFFDAAGLNDYPASVKIAINDLVLALNETIDGSTLWSRIKGFYPFVGSNSEAHSYNLINTATHRITWYGQESHSSFGIQGQTWAEGFYGELDLNPITEGLGNSNHIYIYNRNKKVDYGPVFSATESSINALGIQRWGDPYAQSLGFGIRGICNQQQNTMSVRGSVDQAGHVLFGRSSSTSTHARGLNTSYYTLSYPGSLTAGKFANDGTTPADAPDLNMYILAQNIDGAPPIVNWTQWSNAQLAAASIGLHFTEDQIDAFFVAVQNFQTQLGRAV